MEFGITVTKRETLGFTPSSRDGKPILGLVYYDFRTSERSRIYMTPNEIKMAILVMQTWLKEEGL